MLQDALGMTRLVWLTSSCCADCLQIETDCLSTCGNHPACQAGCFNLYRECVPNCPTSC